MLFQSQQLWLVTAGEDGAVRLWDLVQKSCQATLQVGASTGALREHSIAVLQSLVIAAQQLCRPHQ